MKNSAGGLHRFEATGRAARVADAARYAPDRKPGTQRRGCSGHRSVYRSYKTATLGAAVSRLRTASCLRSAKQLAGRPRDVTPDVETGV